MTISIKYFGLLTDLTACSYETIELEGSTIGELLLQLKTKYPSLDSRNFQVAQDGEIVEGDELISGKEIALLPPFSGG